MSDVWLLLADVKFMFTDQNHYFLVNNTNISLFTWSETAEWKFTNDVS